MLAGGRGDIIAQDPRHRTRAPVSGLVPRWRVHGVESRVAVGRLAEVACPWHERHELRDLAPSERLVVDDEGRRHATAPPRAHRGTSTHTWLAVTSATAASLAAGRQGGTTLTPKPPLGGAARATVDFALRPCSVSRSSDYTDRNSDNG
jgi:hypothetical protein